MQKIVTIVFSILCLVSISNAQDITIFDFDGTTPSFSNGGWGDTFVSDINPLSDAVNSSTNVGKLTEYNAWSPGNSTAVSIDPRVYTSYEVSVYSPNSTTGKIQIQCKDASGNQLDWYEQAVTSSAGWIKFTRNLSFTSKIATVVVFFNHTSSPKNTAEDIVYLDNLVFKKSPSAFITLYNETFFTSWSQWESWSGAPSTKAGSWFGGKNLQTEGDATIYLDRYWNDTPAHEHVLRIAPTSAGVIIADIPVAGFDSLKLSADMSWPWSLAEQDAGYYGVDAADKSPIIDVKIGTGDWISVPTSVIGDWATNVILLKDASGNPINNVNTISIRLSHTPLFTSVYDNVKILGKIRYVFTGEAGSDFTVASNWTGGFVPVAGSDVAVTSGTLALNQDATYHNITVFPAAKLTLNSGKSLGLSALELQSDATGTATFVDNGISTITSATVQQYLSATDRNWYVSSPITSATNANLNTGASVVEYNEELGTWSTVSGSLNPMKGYISTAGSAGTGTLSFLGNLNSGSKSITLSRKGSTKAGFNLVGNPYPSYLSWTEALANSANCLTTVWYRTKSSGVYSFQTYNASGNIGVPLSTTGYVPPMQAFWVRTTVDGSTLTVDNTMRSHGNGSSNLLKAPVANKSLRQLIRLQVSNGTNNDETVLYFNANASAGFDSYDSQKMSNNNPSIPEIYTIAEGENLVINGMQSLPLNTEIPLGVTLGSSATLAIKAAAVENIAPDTQILLKDNATGIVQDLSDGSEYSFNASTQETGRFSLIFKAPSVTTSIDDVKDAQASIYLNLNHQITVRCNNLSPNAKVSVYNSVAQKNDSKPVISKITVIDSQFKSGIYFVTVFNMGKSITKKVVLQ